MPAEICYHCKTDKDIKQYGSYWMCHNCLMWLRNLKLELINEICPEYAKMKFDNFVCSKGDVAVKTCKAFAEGKVDAFGLFLHSKVAGNGKTHLGISILKHWLLNTWTPVFKDTVMVERMFQIVTEPDLFLEIRRSFNSDTEENEADITDKYSKVEFLLADDIGKYSVSDASFLQRVWYNIFNERWLNHRLTVITSNKTGAELKDYLGEYTFDRICGMAKRQVVEVTGESKR